MAKVHERDGWAVPGVAYNGILKLLLTTMQGLQYHCNGLGHAVQPAVLSIEANHGSRDIYNEEQALWLLLKKAHGLVRLPTATVNKLLPSDSIYKLVLVYVPAALIYDPLALLLLGFRGVKDEPELTDLALHYLHHLVILTQRPGIPNSHLAQLFVDADPFPHLPNLLCEGLCSHLQVFCGGRRPAVKHLQVKATTTIGLQVSTLSTTLPATGS
mmetsp:Transcript_112658/g.329239  ORF Transcript_112658/g.329239 Transcript_112658/m.329239 type:complete len:214 (-) Transcript_112658:249-890(-)